MKPIPAMMSIMPVIVAAPKAVRISERMKRSVCSSKRLTWYFSRLLSLIGTMPWKISSSRVASAAPMSRASAAFLRT